MKPAEILDHNTALPREFAARLVAYEAKAGRSTGADDSSGFRVCERMRDSLGKFMGAAGFYSLLSRALCLAARDIPWLRELWVKVDGTVNGFNKLDPKLSAGALAEGEAVLVGHLLGLLVAFIGPTLTMGVLDDTWPGWEFEIADEKKL